MSASLLSYEAPASVRDIISTIDRTEDIRLSPNNQRLAIADFLSDRILLFSIQIGDSPSAPEVHLSDCSILSSKHLIRPHGLAFLDDEHLIVASREGCVAVFAIPSAAASGAELSLDPVCSIEGGFASRVATPGSVDCYQPNADHRVVLVCNNYTHNVSAHQVEIGNEIRVRRSRVLVSRGLEIPDGISVSPDHQWVAVSNHAVGAVWVYPMEARLNRHSNPVGVLSGVVCPHGVRFTPDGTRLCVADAASRYLHVYESDRGDWAIAQRPAKSFRALDAETFASGRSNALEGGLKGIDINDTGSVLMATCQNQVLAFYDLQMLLSQPGDCVPDEEMSELSRQRDQFIADTGSRPLPLWRRLMQKTRQ